MITESHNHKYAIKNENERRSIAKLEIVTQQLHLHAKLIQFYEVCDTYMASCVAWCWHTSNTSQREGKVHSRRARCMLRKFFEAAQIFFSQVANRKRRTVATMLCHRTPTLICWFSLVKFPIRVCKREPSCDYCAYLSLEILLASMEGSTETWRLQSHYCFYFVMCGMDLNENDLYINDERDFVRGIATRLCSS